MRVIHLKALYNRFKRETNDQAKVIKRQADVSELVTAKVSSVVLGN